MDRARLIAALCAAFLTTLSGCAPRLPVPLEADHDGEEPVRVPYPPPPARAEIVPPQPGDKSVWVDGYWEWTGADYSWSAGTWTVPRKNTGYAPPTLVRLRDGALMYYPPAWKRVTVD